MLKTFDDAGTFAPILALEQFLGRGSGIFFWGGAGLGGAELKNFGGGTAIFAGAGLRTVYTAVLPPSLMVFLSDPSPIIALVMLVSN